MPAIISPQIDPTWTAGLSPQVEKEFIGSGERVAFLTGETVFRIGDATTSFWLLSSGVMRMNIATNDNALRFGHLFVPGSYFGEFSLLTQTPRLVEVQAAVPSTAFRFRENQLKALAEKHPQFWHWIAVVCAHNTVIALTAADDLLLDRPEQRVAALLLRLSGHRPFLHRHAVIETLPITQKDLAEASKMSRSSINKILRQFETEGMLALEYKGIRICDAEGLNTCVLHGN